MRKQQKKMIAAKTLKERQKVTAQIMGDTDEDIEILRTAKNPC